MRLIAIALVVAVSGAAAAPDEMLLKDGRIIEGVKISKVKDGYTIHYKNGDVFIKEALVRDCFIEGDTGFQPRNEDERKKVAKGLVPYRGKWIKKKNRDRAIKKRQEAHRKRVEEIRMHRKWRNRYVTKTKHFKFEYTIDPEICANFTNLLEAYYKKFTKTWGIRRPSKLPPLKVCFYHDHEKFSQVAGVGGGVMAYYRFVQPLELNFFYDRVEPEYTIEIMFHEANHHLTHLIDIGFHYPHNVNEAMAEYYGGSKWDPKKKKMSTGHLLEGRLTEVLTDTQGGTWRSLEDFITGKLGYHDYTWGWTFAHFMMETPKYKKKWKSFYLALARESGIKRERYGHMKTVSGDEMLRVFKRKMKVKDLKTLEKEWHDYIKTKLKLTSSRGYEKAAQSAMGTGQTIKAKRYYKLAVEKGSKNPKVYVRYADMLGGKGSSAEAQKLLEKAIGLDPLYADAYAKLGQLKRRGSSKEDEKEGKRLLLLAREIDPEAISTYLEDIIEKLTEKE